MSDLLLAICTSPRTWAHALAAADSHCTTPGAVKARVKAGIMRPDYVTQRGGVMWTAAGLARELAAEHMRMLVAAHLGASNTGVLLRMLPRWIRDHKA